MIQLGDFIIKMPVIFDHRHFLWYCLSDFVVFFVGYGFEPFGGGLFTGDFKGEVCEPTVGCGSVPVFYVCRNVDDCAG